MRRGERTRGFSLLEAIFATAIFVAAMAAIGALLDLGLFSIRSAERSTIALLRCESKLEELSAGLEPLWSAESQAFLDDPSWSWSLALEETGLPTLVKATVQVEHRADEQGEVDASCRLSRWLCSRPEATTAEATEPVPITIRELLGLGAK